MTDGLALREYLGQMLGAQHVAEGGGGQQMRRVAVKKALKVSTA